MVLVKISFANRYLLQGIVQQVLKFLRRLLAFPDAATNHFYQGLPHDHHPGLF